jgi:hypothetical protein
MPEHLSKAERNNVLVCCCASVLLRRAEPACPQSFT